MKRKPTKKLEDGKLYHVCRACKNRRKQTIEVDHSESILGRLDAKCDICEKWEFDLWPVRVKKSVLELLAEAADGPDETR